LWILLLQQLLPLLFPFPVFQSQKETRMRFSRWSLAVVAAALVLATSPAAFGQRAAGRSQASDAPFEITAEQVANPPERQLEFVESDEPVAVQLPRPDAELLERKYVVTFQLKVPSLNSGDPYLREIGEPERIGGGYLYRVTASSGFGDRGPTELGKALSRMLEGVPEERRPPAEALTFFDSTPPDIQTTVSHAVIDGQPVIRRSFTIYANTPDDAKQFVKALLTIFDEGVSRPIQLRLFERLEEQKAQAAPIRDAIEKLQNEIRDLEKEAEEVADYQGELLPALRVQQLQLESEQAGIDSRIAACDKLLKEGGLTVEQADKLRELKTVAAVDLASNEARRKTTAAFVDKVKRSIGIQAKIDEQKRTLAPQMTEWSRAQSRIRSTQALIKAYQPLEVDGKVTIRPLVWAK
jgi:hypothetical protein